MSVVNFKAEDLSTKIRANNAVISSGKDIVGKATQIHSKGDSLLYAGRNLELSAYDYKYFHYPNGMLNSHKDIAVPNIHSNKNLTLLANNAISIFASKLSSDGDIKLSSGGDIGFVALNNYFELRSNNSTREEIKPQGVELNSGGNLSIITDGNLLFQATKLMAKGAINIAAKGGYLYAQAKEDISHYETEETKRKWYGKKKTTTKIRHDVTNKVTEFIANGDINLLSHDDSTYEASKIETNKNAKLTSTHGKVNFKAVKDTSFEQTISESKGFFIKNRDSGHTKEKWVLPSIHIGGKLTVDAANGISADIKTKNDKSLQNVLATLGDTPETAWLKELNRQQDVKWNEVKDAYDSWDYKSQHLSPAVSAVIAIAVAVATAGAGVTVAAAGGAAGVVGGAATAAGASVATAAAASTATYGAVTSGIAVLASKAAVTLVDNQGNLSKTFKVMGSSDTVKSTITSMAIGGVLAGFDNVMGWDKAADGAVAAKSNIPLLSKGDWSKVAQRVAGQSIISSSLNTTINGGSFKDNFTAALLANVGNQINAEGADFIGDYEKVLGESGRAISHTALSAFAAEIGGGDAKGAAAGSLAASLAYPTLDNTFSDPAKIQAGGRIIGGIAGAFSTNSAQGANSGEITIVYNHLAHALSAAEKHKPGTIKAHEEKTAELCVQSPDVCERAAATFSVSADFLPVIGDIKGFAEAETAIDYLAAVVGLIPGAGDVAGKLLKGADKALKHGDLETASKLIHQAHDEIGILSKVNVEHVFHGEINRKGKAVGFHHEASIGHQGKARITEITDLSNAQGVYRGKVEVFNSQTGQWVSKDPKSTFFPQSWNRQQVLSEIKGAYKNSTMQGSKWEGISPSGVRIGGYLDKNGNINTAFPVYEGVK
ncbi:DUF637 domain-containing protein [Photorhabdus kleinii]|uniref:DUF637 domain-containing protein n=1 Tax=Photorhabdus kleinii TaxID=768034 RepID=UPI0021D4F5FE|nr:DUF637 domain-containing protein [Photorhabdus kleinii]MCT8342710.1 DUF637 domain-containing protein [Photorhabdus kleinii]